MFKRKRDSDTQLDDYNDANESSGNNNQDKQLRLQDHQRLACNDTTQTSVIDVENPKLFRQCTDPLEWNLIKFRDMRATHSRRAFGRVLYRKSLFPSMVLLHQHLTLYLTAPQRMLLQKFGCAMVDRYHFCFPDQKKCVPFVCAYNNSKYFNNNFVILLF